MSGLPQVVILGGGRGTRLGSLTDTIPKPMVAVAGEPFVVHQLRWLARAGVDRIVYSVGHLGAILAETVQTRAPQLGLTAAIVDEGPMALGTAGAVRFALDLGVLEPEFLLLYGDSYPDLDLAAVVETFNVSECEALMTVCSAAGLGHTPNVRLLDGRVDRYDKRPSPDELPSFHHIDYGVTMLRRDTIRARLAPGERTDLAEILGDLAETGDLGAFVVPERFEEMGSPEGLRRVRALLEGPR